MRKRKSVVVELTSLLDVIFIMLFMVMSRNSTATAEAQEAAREQVSVAEAHAALMENERDSYKTMLRETEEERENLSLTESRLNSYEVFSEYARIISVYVVDSGYKRSVHVAEETEIASADYGWDNMDYAKEALDAALEECTTGDAPVFIVFSYDSDKIYRQDYNMIAEAITSAQSGKNHVYIKFDDTTEKS
ncbi:MAG: hypothetical protein IJ416_11735 [Ruminiclostridium sp.]|nr:hypothetical protein [Ruminiclostridium sp.]